MSDDEILGVPFTNISDYWWNWNHAAISFPKYLEKQSFTVEVLSQPSTRALITRKEMAAEPNPFLDQEAVRGELWAYAKGLVIFKDAARSPSLTGVLARGNGTFFYVRPFLERWRPDLRPECTFGQKRRDFFRPGWEGDGVTFVRRVGKEEGTTLSTGIASEQWKPLNEWLDHWLPE